MHNSADLSAALAQLSTPCLLLDESRLQRNIDRMNVKAEMHSVQLRPHVKTAKCTEVARRIFNGGTGPITVSTLREAEYFFADGFDDILYAVSMVSGKVARAAALARAGARLRLIVDDLDSARGIAAAAQREGVVFELMIEIDADGHRAGLKPGDARIVEIAQLAQASSHLKFAGVMTHAGASYDCVGAPALRAHGKLERDAVVQAADQLRAAGIACASVSLGSTPSVSFVESLAGVTEIRVGVYVFNDLVQSNLGVCALDDIALSVLTTVISHKRDTGCLIVDAGGLALSKDHGTARQAVDYGYGQVCHEDGTPLPGLCVREVNQEHGLIAAGSATLFDALPIGTRLRLLPNHACMTAAAYDSYHVIHGGGVRTWPRCNGW